MKTKLQKNKQKEKLRLEKRKKKGKCRARVRVEERKGEKITGVTGDSVEVKMRGKRSGFKRRRRETI